MATQVSARPPRSLFLNVFQNKNLDSIDSIRGYAVLLVMLCHTMGHIPNLPWPVKRVAGLGIYGVQLFFLASALTLAMSWAKDNFGFISKTRSFYISRLFRILPLYYAAIPFYYFVKNLGVTGLDTSTLFATIFFYNSWVPEYTYPFNPWSPVPGGWSISVEMTFYLAFPLIIPFIKNTMQAAAFLIVAMLAAIAFPYYTHCLLSSYPPDQSSLFLYYSPVNQLPIFALGIFLYRFLLSHTARCLYRNNILANLASLMVIAVFLAASFSSQSRTFSLSPFAIPTHLILSFALAAWVGTTIACPTKIITNKISISIGKVSFSIYILHFAVLDGIDRLARPLSLTALTDYAAIAYFSAIFIITTIATFVFATATHKYIEKPFIRLGRKLNIKLGALIPEKRLRPELHPRPDA